MPTSDLVLLAYILLIVPAMLVGFYFARRHWFEPHHKLTMTTITIVNWVLIIGVMLVTYRRDVLPGIPLQLNQANILIPTLHLIPGAIAQLLATYLVIRMWFENQLPEWFKVKNIKIYMRTTLVLWLITALLGILTWGVINKGFLAPATTPNAANAPAVGAAVVRFIAGNKFAPETLEITTGTTVEFINDDTRGHTVTADDGSFDSGNIKAGEKFSVTFNQPGDIPYFCDFHGAAGHTGMAGLIKVTGKPIEGAVVTATPKPPVDATPESTPDATTEATPEIKAATTDATPTAGGSTTAAALPEVVITMNDDTFDPPTITVTVGTTIRWDNKGKRKHTVTADDDSFDSAQVKAGDSFKRTFDKIGDIAIYCANHGDKGGQGMSMIVKVVAATTDVATTAIPAVAATTAAPSATTPPTATTEVKAAATNTTAATAASAGATTVAALPEVVVSMNDDAFDPPTITVTVGTTIRWDNKGKRKHTVTADDDSFDSAQVKPGESFKRTFDKIGDFAIYCANHGDKGGQGMSMIVKVVAATAPSANAAATSVPASATTKATVAAVVATTVNPPTATPSATTPPTATPLVKAAATNTTAPTAASGGATAVAALPEVVVSMNDDVFDPAIITVTVGTTIRWDNKGTHKHTVTADDDSFDSAQIKPGESFKRTFDKIGDIAIYCANHGDKGGQDMSMIVKVVAATVPTANVPATSVPATATTKATVAAVVATTVNPPTATLLSINPAISTAGAPLVVAQTDTPKRTAYVVGVQTDVAIIEAQVTVMTKALSEARYEDAQAAAEAILNVIESGAGTDRDADGKINQLGDGYGLRTYIFSMNEAAGTLGEAAKAINAVAETQAADAILKQGQALLVTLQAVSTQAQAVLNAKTLIAARTAGAAVVQAARPLRPTLVILVAQAATLKLADSRITPLAP